MATAPLRSGFAEINSSHRVLCSPISYRVGPWPAILGWTSNLYSSIRSSRSSSVASLPLPRSTPSGVASLSFFTPVRRSSAMWWLLVHGKSFRVEDTTYFGLASSLTAHSRIAGGASASPNAAHQLRQRPHQTSKYAPARAEGVSCIPPSRRAVTPHQMTCRLHTRSGRMAACHHHGHVGRYAIEAAIGMLLLTMGCFQ